MDNTQKYTKDEILTGAKKIKQHELEYKKVIQKKPNIKYDGVDTVVDWLQDILMVFKK